MKEVILTHKQTIELDKLPTGCTLGVQDEEGFKGWVQRLAFRSSDVRLFCMDGGLSFGAGWVGYDGEIHETLNKWLDDGHKLYLFDSEKELFKWLSED